MSRFHNVFCLTEKKQLEIVFLQGKQKNIAATGRTIFHWEMGLQFAVQKIWMPRSMPVAKVTEYVYYVNTGIKIYAFHKT